ncbi:hypothetical protein [Methanoregula sp.]|uniref:hypothetical protein n=1 Tax=Methanoregula sp. TaxID=2052170 RepID=UPI002B7514AF|nr:hypothetical protein [Methanoregula sp.]HVP97273.1 hypothetical protein [Methanoregula sp.]
MKMGIVCLCALVCIGLVLVAGCTSATTGTPGTEGKVAASQEQVVTLVNGTYTFNASIDDITTTALPSGGHRVDIFVTVNNVGGTPIQLQWFSTLTNTNGVSFGGVGVSHGGSGAETPPLGQGTSATGRDYVTIVSDQDYQSLKNGATLTVNFVTEPFHSESPVSFSTSWPLNPADFT